MDQNRNGSLGPITVTKFPEDIEAVPHKMVITIRSRDNNYSRSGGSITAGTITGRGANMSGAVVLPVPSNIIENYSASYDSVDLGVIGNAIATAASGAMQGIQSSQGLSGYLGSAGGVIAGAARDLSGVDPNSNSPVLDGISNLAGAALYQSAINLSSAAAGYFGQSVNTRSAIAAGTGLIFNPHKTAVFSGVNLRAVRYNWVLAPKKEKESQSIEKIVSILRNAMLPRRSENALFLKFPDEVVYKILGPTQEYSMPTAPCVITDISLDRTGAGGPTFFAKTGAPVIYNLSLSLLEIKALLRDDFVEPNNPAATPANPTPTPRVSGAGETPSRLPLTTPE